MNTPTLAKLSLEDPPPGGDAFNDATQLIALAAEAIQESEILSMDTFTLFDAMNAIEIMDPRMDTGVNLLSGGDTPVFDPRAPLSAQEISWVLDRVLAAEMDWHSGSFMANTIHTCSYVHQLPVMTTASDLEQSREDIELRPKALGPFVLRPAVIGFLKTCDLAWRQMTQGLIYDGEDFHGEKFEVSLCEAFQTPKVLEMLEGACVWLDSMPGLPHRNMLLARLRLRKALLRAFSHPPDNPGSQQIWHIQEALSILQEIIASPHPEEPITGSAAIAAFNPSVARDLVFVTPLKPIPLSSQNEAWAMLREMLAELLYLYEIADSGTPLEWMTLLVLKTQSVHSRRRTGFVRSITAAILKIKPQQWLWGFVFGDLAPISQDYISSLAFTMSDPHDSHYFNSVWGDVQHRIRELLEHLFLTLCQNRPRCRRSIAQVLFNWHKCEEDVTIFMEITQPPLQNNPLALCRMKQLSLVIHHIRMSMVIDYVLSGFETDLYQPSEYPFMYYYLVRKLAHQIEIAKRIIKSGEEIGEPGSHAPYEWLLDHIRWCHALFPMCTARFVMLVPLIDSPLLFPVLGDERQRLNILRRFDWSFPPPKESTDLPDVATPNWDAYLLPVASVRNMGEATRRDHVIARVGEALDAIDDLELRGAQRSAAGLCPALWEQRLFDLRRAGKRILATVADDRGGLQDVGSTWSHPWFPDV